MGAGEGGGGRGREIVYLSLHCHHQNDSCIKMGSDERLFLLPLWSACVIYRYYLCVYFEFVSLTWVCYYFKMHFKECINYDNVWSAWDDPLGWLDLKFQFQFSALTSTLNLFSSSYKHELSGNSLIRETFLCVFCLFCCRFLSKLSKRYRVDWHSKFSCRFKN